jgi:glycosyltransferase involved in cell wall biosynthesis
MHFTVNAHLLSPVPGYRQAGVSRYIDQLLRRLLRLPSGDRWTVYAPAGVAPFIGSPPHTRLRESRLPTTNPLVRILWEQCFAPLLALRDRPAALFCPLNVVPFLTPCPSVVAVHDLAFLRFPELRGPAKRRYLTLLTRASVHRAARVLTVSEFTRREVIELLGVAPEKVTTTLNGGDERLGPLPPEDVARFRAAHQLPAQFLLFLGTLEPRKNLTTLLRAYARTKASIRMPLIVAGGKGWMFESIFALVEELGLQHAVRFAGFVPQEELGLWYNAATAFVYPPLYEGFGLPALEAMQCGTPVVTSNAASLPEVVGDAALTVDPTAVEQLAAALARVATEPALRDELRARGLAQARRFSWDQTAAATLDALHAVARP